MDTVAAVRDAAGIERVLVLWEDDADAQRQCEYMTAKHVVADGLDLNTALEHGVAVARRHMPEAGVVVVPSDLPALQPWALRTYLERAQDRARAFVSDAEMTGTSVMSVTGGVFCSRCMVRGPA